ncbi:MAG TPA: SGNH/GDSL hydrolase family protein [Thermoanaerobaculia bacterium]|nr:SGNH/GDSL hydrolase family protein [Thermoanaerobaculia bacterium]
MDFRRYVSLGDSISIDVYPAEDARLRFPGRFTNSRLGAASLLVRNDDRLWPEFRGRELRGVRHEDVTADGATTHDLLVQAARVTPSDDATLITITAGGNDLLAEIGGRGASPAPAIASRLREAVARLFELRPNSLMLIGTVYDPSDGTKRLPGFIGTLDRESAWLDEYNALVRELAQSDDRLRLADIHHHFLGHGLTAPEEERWYLRESIIEPSARGASEVRRLWLDAIG